MAFVEADSPGIISRMWGMIRRSAHIHPRKMSKTLREAGAPAGQAPPSSDENALVTVCAWSRTVRYRGEWMQFEQYLSKRFGLIATHGISPRALAKLEAGSDIGMDEADGSRNERLGAVRNPRRLAALRRTGLLDSPSSEGFDRATRLGAVALSVPATFISLVDEHRDFYLSNVGFGEPLASTRQLEGQTFCHFTIEREEPLVIPDTRADPVYSKVPTVETLGVAAYLGAPLILNTGEIIGAFCAIDQSPREWTPSEIACARDLASVVVTEIELRAAVSSFAADG